MTTLLTGRAAWKNHPATKMWRGYESTLLEYQKAMCDEWVTHVTAKGAAYSDTCFHKTLAVYTQHRVSQTSEPFWLGDDRVHISHQSRLVQKDPEHYRSQFPDAPTDLEYFWPVL